MIRHVVDPELAIGKQQVLDRTAIVLYLRFGDGKERPEVLDVGGERHVVCFDSVVGVGLFEFGDEELALVQEDGAAVEIERVPEQGLVSEAENEEIASGRAMIQCGGDRGDLREGHVGCR